MKVDRVSVRLDDSVLLELQELCKCHNARMSTVVRMLLIKSLNELRNVNNVDTSKTKQV